jgi:hypothetical protein
VKKTPHFSKVARRTMVTTLIFPNGQTEISKKVKKLFSPETKTAGMISHSDG